MLMKVLVTVFAMLVWSTAPLAGDKGMLGALIGAGVGAGIGHAVDRGGGSGKGAIIGAIGGYVIGSQMEKNNDQKAAKAPADSPRQGSAMHSNACVKADKYVDQSASNADNDDRIYYLEKAVKLCPTHARAHNDLGVAYYNRNARHDFSRAKSEFRQALDIDPGYTVAKNNLKNL